MEKGQDRLEQALVWWWSPILGTKFVSVTQDPDCQIEKLNLIFKLIFSDWREKGEVVGSCNDTQWASDLGSS